MRVNEYLKKMGKKLVLMAAVGTMLSFLPNGNAAAAHEYSITNPNGFNNGEWEYTVYYQYEAYGNTCNGIKFVFGFDTFAINEDYAWSYSHKKDHKAGISNANTSAWTRKRSTGQWAKEEVTHSGNSVTYLLWVDDTTVYSRTGIEKSSMK